MEAFFLDIFDYQHYYNKKLVELLKDDGKSPSEKVIFLFSHMINAHQIWNARILDQKTIDAFQVHSIDECAKINLENYAQSLKILKESDFDKIIFYKNSSGVTYHNSIRDICFHISNHHTYHRGQIMANLRKIGIEPIISDYIFYKR